MAGSECAHPYVRYRCRELRATPAIAVARSYWWFCISHFPTRGQRRSALRRVQGSSNHRVPVRARSYPLQDKLVRSILTTPEGPVYPPATRHGLPVRLVFATMRGAYKRDGAFRQPTTQMKFQELPLGNSVSHRRSIRTPCPRHPYSGELHSSAIDAMAPAPSAQVSSPHWGGFTESRVSLANTGWEEAGLYAPPCTQPTAGDVIWPRGPCDPADACRPPPCEVLRRRDF